MKQVPNFSRYMADEKGNVWTTNWKNSGQTRMMKPAIGADGYPQSMFRRDDGKYVTMKIHKVVALAYYGERKEGMEVNHMNGNKLDNRPENLDYCTRSFNVWHSFVEGLQKPKRGEDNGHAKLTEAAVREIRHTAATGGRYYGRARLAAKFGVSEAHVKDIVNQRRGTWSHVK